MKSFQKPSYLPSHLEESSKYPESLKSYMDRKSITSRMPPLPKIQPRPYIPKTTTQHIGGFNPWESVNRFVSTNTVIWLVILTIFVVVLLIWLIIITTQTTKYMKNHKEKFTADEYASMLSGMWPYGMLNQGDDHPKSYLPGNFKYDPSIIHTVENGSTPEQYEEVGKYANQRLGIFDDSSNDKADSNSMDESEMQVNSLFERIGDPDMKQMLALRDYSDARLTINN